MIACMQKDVKKRPDLFIWNGAIEKERLKQWLEERKLKVPNDLFEFWKLTGGGDFFETETILGPFGDPSLGDDVDGRNEFHHEKGLSEECLIFHVGWGMSAVRLSDGKYIRLDEDTYEEIREFSSLEDWYLNEIREECADRYGLDN